MLDIQVEHRGALVTVRPVGEMDAYTVGRFRESLAKLPDGQVVVIVLSQVPFLDSAGLGALIGAVRRIREGGGKVAVVSHPAMSRLFHKMGLDRIVLVSESVEEAGAALLEPPPGEIEIALYLDTDNEVVVEQVARAADQLAAYMGYGHPVDSRVGQG